MATQLPTGIVTLVFTDIQGSSELWERYQTAFQPLLDKHNSLMRETLIRWNGNEVKTEGDAFFLSFASAADAVQFAIDAQRAMADAEWVVIRSPASPSGESARLELRVRMGVHSGEALLGRHPDGTVDYFGPVVNRAARIGSAGHGGQVVVSDTTYHLTQASLPVDVTFQDLGVHRLKGVGEERLWQVQHPDLPREFPPLKTLNPERHNLPLPPTPFIGRETELAAWCDLLHQPTTRLLTLVAFGGMGKTRVALQLAELSLDAFPEGVWLVELEEACNPEEMVLRIAHDLRLDLQLQSSVKEQLLRFLSNRKLLLVLDNTEQIHDAAGVINDLLKAAANIKCLVTTRRALDLRAERLVEVKPLPASDSETLFLDRARARLSDFTINPENAGDISELCRRLEGVPLAIELAASRIRAMSPREIINRLDARFSLLQSRSPDLAPRQRALRAIIDWSYELLSEENKELFAQLSVFAGGFTLMDAEAVCDSPEVAWSVEELLSHSLLRSEIDAATQQTRYSMLESLRDYAAERMEELGEARRALLLRHAQHFLRVVREGLRKLRTPEEAAALRDFEINYDNVRAAEEWTLAEGRLDCALELALALGIFYQRRGFLNEARQQLAAGLDAAQQWHAMPPRLHARLLRECASLELDHFRWAEARNYATEALGMYEREGDLQGAADVNNLLGLAAMGEEDYAKARSRFTLALEQFQRADDRVGIAIVQNNLGLVEFKDGQGSREKTLHHWEECLRLHRENRDQRGIAEILTNLGVLAQTEHRLEDAWRYHEEALSIENELRHTLGVGRALSNLGESAELMGDTQTACRLFAAAECLFNKVGSPYKRYVADLLHNLGSGAEENETLASRRLHLKEKSLDDLIAWALGKPPTA